MSHEVLVADRDDVLPGAVHERAAAATLVLDPSPSPAAPTPAAAPPGGRRGATVLVALVALAGAALGWTGLPAPGDPVAQPGTVAPLSAVVVSAPVALSADVAGGTDDPLRRTTLTVTVRNVDRVPWRLALPAAADVGNVRVTAVTALDAPGGPPVVPARGSRQVRLDVRVVCTAPQPLVMPALQASTAAGAQTFVPVTLAGQPLVDLCQSDDTFSGGGVLYLDRAAAQPNGTLALTLRSPTGRPLQVTGVSVAGVPLGLGESRSVGGTASLVYLRPPPACESAWSDGGLSARLDVDVDVGETATVTLLAGDALLRWWTAGPCGGSHLRPDGRPHRRVGNRS